MSEHRLSYDELKELIASTTEIEGVDRNLTHKFMVQIVRLPDIYVVDFLRTIVTELAWRLAGENPSVETNIQGMREVTELLLESINKPVE